MSAPSRCPDPRLLQQLLLGRLPADVAGRLEQHVEQCSHCARLLPTLPAEDSLVESVRAQGKAARRPAEQGAVRGLIPRLQGLQVDTGATGTPAGRTMQRPAAAVSSDSGPAPLLKPALGPGELGRLGPYRVLKVLGQGGMGVVYQAEDPMLQRTVALKVMLPGIAQRPGAKERFLREARATAKIEHDHIVTIYQVGEDQGVPYLAMQLLKGMSLEDLLKKKAEPGSRPFTLDQILKLGREIARGLAAAHQHGLIHRDIKPANVWLDAAAGGRVKILDFGLARAAEGEAQPLTQFGTVVGTAAYMAPEQAQGRKVDGRADLFSLGCVLYRLCAGRLPWLGRNTMELLIAVSSEEPPPVQELNPHLPPALARLVMQLLAKRPEDRPASAKAVVEAIQAIERDQPTQQMVRLSLPVPVAVAVPTVTVCEATADTAPAAPPRPYRARRRHRPFLFAGAVGGLAVVALGAAVLYVQLHGAAPKTEAAAATKVREVVGARPKESRPASPTGTGPKIGPPDTPPQEPLDTRPPDSVKYVSNSLGMKFAPVPAGEFLMGTSAEDFERFKKEPFGYWKPEPTEGPQHKVKLTKPFHMGAFLVTQGQYEQVMKKNPSAFKEDADHAAHPVDTVNWYDAVAFCAELSALPEERKAGRVYRLPTEAEWEYACRAGTSSTTAYGPTLSSRQANIDGDKPLGNAPKGPKIGKPVPGGKYPPNAWGLYDMHGNLWQWCSDGPRPYTAEAVEDPVGPNTWGPKNEPARVLRGGSWRDGGVSASFRKPRDPTMYRMNFIGLRVVYEP